MQIHGLQKMTLLDYPGHIACTVFLGGCDFRCPYCHNFELVNGSMEPVVDEEEFFRFLNKRKGLLDGVAITGGEPLLRRDIRGFIERIRDLNFLIKLDTNGYHPDELDRLLNDGLIDYVAMDIKNSPEKYSLTCGEVAVDTSLIERSISIIREKAPDYEFRTTVVKEFHELNDFEYIGILLRGAKAYYLQQYVERDTVPDKSLHAPSNNELLQYLDIVKTYVPNSSIRGI
ncbi:MAG: anaerobic ribonucleoside-triphosphate reductase activating protein [Butyrivibrio sp.]|nr:anaerobic ribonucleoside-triphosphate reductase activating protein [Butyrivibrio sp.]